MKILLRLRELRVQLRAPNERFRPPSPDFQYRGLEGYKGYRGVIGFISYRSGSVGNTCCHVRGSSY